MLGRSRARPRLCRARRGCQGISRARAASVSVASDRVLCTARLTAGAAVGSTAAQVLYGNCSGSGVRCQACCAGATPPAAKGPAKDTSRASGEGCWAALPRVPAVRPALEARLTPGTQEPAGFLVSHAGPTGEVQHAVRVGPRAEPGTAISPVRRLRGLLPGPRSSSRL